MVTLFMVTANGVTGLGLFKGLRQTVEYVRSYWMECPEGPQAFFIVGDDGETLASLMRDQADPAICHTTYCWGEKHSHLCTYVLDGEGKYVTTRIAALCEQEA